MEWPIVALIALIVIVGGSKLPSIARNVGRAQGELKKGLTEGAQEAAEAAAEHESKLAQIAADKAKFDDAVAQEVAKRADNGSAS
jgi:sec-independent protein translocase protein TatA